MCAKNKNSLEGLTKEEIIKKYEELEKENEKLRDVNEKLEKENKVFKKIFSSIINLTSEKTKKGIVKKIKEALKKLAFYESPNMPSSMPKLNSNAPTSTDKKSKLKRGGQKGHKPANRKKPDKIDEVDIIKLTHCPDCDTKLGKPLKTRRTRIVEDIVFENCVKVILYIILV